MATRTEDVTPRRTNPLILAVVGLLVLLLVLWFFFLRGGGTAEEPLAVPTPNITVAPTEEPADEERTTRGNGPLETFEVFAPKDPFKPAISEETLGTTPGATEGAVAAAGDTTGDGTGGTGAPSGGSDIRGGSSGGGGSSVGGHRVRLIDTFTSGGEARARVQVDGTVYTVGEGDRFADNFELLSVNGQCASMLFGDDQFSLCEGEEILK